MRRAAAFGSAGGHRRLRAQRFSTVMRFCVSVPVLSDAITVALPSDSMMLVRLMSTCRSAMRFAVMDRQEATVAGSPSGTLATITMMNPFTKLKMNGRPRPSPIENSTTAVNTAMAAITSTNRCTWGKRKRGGTGTRAGGRISLAMGGGGGGGRGRQAVRPRRPAAGGCAPARARLLLQQRLLDDARARRQAGDGADHCVVRGADDDAVALPVHNQGGGEDEVAALDGVLVHRHNRGGDRV